jgi:prolyl 4-hydroxylase
MDQLNFNVISKFIGSAYINLNLCDKIIDHFNNSPNKHLGTTRGIEGSIVEPKTKDSIDLRFDNTNLLNLYLENLQKELVDPYIKEYQYCDEQGPWGIVEYPNIQYYKPSTGGYKIWHCERSSSNYPHSSRHLVYMTYLNDVEEGGETEFFYQNLSIKPKKGLSLIWPSDWMFTHRGKTSQNDKHIVTGWFGFTS